MPYYRTHLGRFGDLGAALVGIVDPDLRAAHAYAANGAIGARPTLAQILATKGFLDPADPAWVAWLQTFGQHRNNHMGQGGGPLVASCPTSWPGYPRGMCLHELTPPLLHGNLRWFSNRIGVQANNIISKPNGSLGVDPSSRPLWNFIVTSGGDILISSEDFELIKHTCIAGGLEVWSAGQVGIESGTMRIVDLQSGHYVKSNMAPGTPLALQLRAFTQGVFVDYARTFGLGCLHANFACVWA